MEVDETMTLREAKAFFYKKNRFPSDGGVSKNKWAPVACRDLKVYLPNFKWRRKALPYHDLHHVLTGYEFRPTGEFQIAAWEFAAGKYPNIYTTLFCIPLVSLGAILIPARTFKAFVRGRKSKTLYSVNDYEKLLDRKVFDVKKEIISSEQVDPCFEDYLEYIKLVTCSFLVLSSPIVLLLIIFLGVT